MSPHGKLAMIVAPLTAFTADVFCSQRQQQASALAYFDVFWLLAVVTLLLMPVVLLMKRSVAEKGAHIGHE